MSINLNNLNLSLDTFNDIASGNYNIGEVRLTADGKGLTKVNNHKNTWFFSNNTSVSSEEALAIKNAFVKALSDSGMAPDALNNIREQLGITNAIELLKTSTVKPLSRQEIRDIIDQNAEAINSRRTENGEEALKTSEQIYAGMSSSTREAHQAIRDQRNEKLASSRAVVMSHDVKNLMTILTGNFAGKQEQSGDIEKMNHAMWSALVNPPKDVEEYNARTQSVKIGEPTVTVENGTVQVTFRTDNMSLYKVDTKLTERAFLQKMKSIPNPQNGGWEYIADKQEAIGKLSDAICNKRKRMSTKDKAQMRQMLETILEENFEDKEFMSLLINTPNMMMNLLMTKDSNLRDETSFRKKVEELKQNVESFRSLEKKYPGAYVAGMEALKAKGGKAFNLKIIEQILEVAGNLKLERLGSSTEFNLQELHGILRSMNETRMQLAFERADCNGEDDRTAIRTFIFIYAINQLDLQTEKNVLKILHSKSNVELYSLFYNIVSTGIIEGPKGFDISDSKYAVPRGKALEFVNTISEINIFIHDDFNLPCVEVPVSDEKHLAANIPDDILAPFDPAQADIQ